MELGHCLHGCTDRHQRGIIENFAASEVVCGCLGVPACDSLEQAVCLRRAIKLRDELILTKVEMRKFIANLVTTFIPFRKLRKEVRMKILGAEQHMKETSTWVMSPQERALFIECIKDAKNYLEFGTGGSTIAALEQMSNREGIIYCLESSREWVTHMIGTYEQIRDGLASHRLIFEYVDIGKTKEWGVPVDEERKNYWPEYSSTVFANKKDFDLILVDGRFRVACALAAILATSENTVIMLHDFPSRPQYHTLLKYLDAIAMADSLVVFRKRPNLDMKNVAEEYEKYKYDYA